MLPVGGAHRSYGKLHAGKVYSLTTADEPALHNAAAGLLGRALRHHESDRTVGEHHRIADGEFVDQPFIRDGKLIGCLTLAAADKPQRGSLKTLNSATGNFAEPNLGAGQIDKHPNRPAGGLGHPPHPAERFLMFLDRTVRHIETKDIDTGIDKAPQGGFLTAGRTDSGNNLCADDRGDV